MLGISILDEQRTTTSHILHGATGLPENEDQPCQLDCLEENVIHMRMVSLPPSTKKIPLHRHYHPGTKKGKAYCYISAHKQVLNGFDTPALGQCEPDRVIGYSDSYC